MSFGKENVDGLTLATIISSTSFANSPVGTFFLDSVDPSSEIANAYMLIDLLEKHIDEVGKENVVS